MAKKIFTITLTSFSEIVKMLTEIPTLKKMMIGYSHVIPVNMIIGSITLSIST